MALPNITKTRNILSNAATFWIPVKKYRRALRGILLMGVRKYIRVLRSDVITNFPQELSIVAIMKNEGPYLKEWLDFHILVGVRKFYLYDNESTDNTTEILAPYIESGIVEYTLFPGRARQNAAYIDAINRHSMDTRWLALIDLDEFIVPVNHETISEFLHTLPRNFGALVVTWVMYGSSGHIKKPAGLLMENYKYRAAPFRSRGVKSIINPRLAVRQTNPHLNDVAGFIIDENGRRLGRVDQANNPPSHDKIRCNHYVTKSFEEYKARCNKGSAACADKDYAHKKWTRDLFDGYDTNDIYDPIMDKYIPRLKQK